MESTVAPFRLEEFVAAFAEGIKRADKRRPQAMNLRSHLSFQPGIGPHSEAQTIQLVMDEIGQQYPHYELAVPYPNTPLQKCDLCPGASPAWIMAAEVKMLRLFGDNGRPNDNMLMHLLSPYPQHRSALTDCGKLAVSGFLGMKAIMIYGYDHPEWPLEDAVEAFETLAR